VPQRERFRGESIRAKILIIDDDPLVIAALRLLLGKEYDVVAETSERAALARLQSGAAFDVVLCDLMMPEITGMDIYERLSATHPTMVGRMVFMTGAATTKRAMEFIGSGVRCVEKPFDIPRLRRIIASLVRRR
jgi:CheY-like chemotaxis protein